MPLLDAGPSPLSTLKAPPLTAALRPAAAIADPPDPLVPPPALTATTPARPAVDVPDPRLAAPPFPAAARPELNASLSLIHI